MPLTDADFASRFDVRDAYVWIECNRETCYAYFQPREGGLMIGAWLFNLVDGPEMPKRDPEGPPVLDRHRTRPFDFENEVDPGQFLVTGGEFEGVRAYEIWYADILIGVLMTEWGKSQSAFATAVSDVARPLDRSAALQRHFRRVEAHIRHVVTKERDNIPDSAREVVEQMLDHAEYGLALENLEMFESGFSPESRDELEKVRLVRGELAE